MHKNEMNGKTYWRSIAEYAGTPEYQAALEGEFQGYDPEEILSMPRRQFLRLAGASMALAGLTLTACRRWPEEHIVPFNQRPAGYTPGGILNYASSIERGGVAQSVLVQTYDGRPIKVEANLTKGANGRLLFAAPSLFDQAEPLNLYDPDRLRNPEHAGAKTTWEAIAKGLEEAMVACPSGQGFWIVSEAQSGASFARLAEQLQAAYPQSRLVTWEAINRSNAYAGAAKAFGRGASQKALRANYHLDQANIIAVFDGDPLGTDANASANSRDWAAGRRIVDDIRKDRSGKERMSRLYVAEPAFTLTGSNADERLALKPSEVLSVLQYVAHGLGVAGVEAVTLHGYNDSFAKKLLSDIQGEDHRGGARTAIFVGDGQPADVHALACAIMAKVNAIGTTVEYIEVEDSAVVSTEAVAEFQAAVASGEAKAALVLGGNPAFDMPGGVDLSTLAYSFHLASHANETTAQVQYALPQAHTFECWGDARSYDGRALLQQPQIEPIFDGRSALEVLGSMVDPSYTLGVKKGREIVQDTWKDVIGAGFAKGFAAALQQAYIGEPSSAVQVKAVESLGSLAGVPAAAIGEYELVFRQGALYDGRYANNGWLQETPDQLTKITWDNPVLVGPVGARAIIGKQDLKDFHVGESVFITTAAGSELNALFVSPGVADGVAVVTSGHGRETAGRVGKGVGFNTYKLRSANEWSVASASLRARNEAYRLSTTSVHHLIAGPLSDEMGRNLIEDRVGEPVASGTSKGYLFVDMSLDDFVEKGKRATNPHGNIRLQLFDPNIDQETENEELHAWGMAIDLSTCTGCSACVVACQSENNIPNVGKDQVWRSREMHWIRSDTYYKFNGKEDKQEVDNPNAVEVSHMPVACVHCENAACEQVCPVAATVHDTEGLNTMVYNRCIGTRYCSNNCPYKVRRYNYFDFHVKPTSKDVANPWLNAPDQQQVNGINVIRKLGFNPDVTVRMRGVMEKCTYCIQRIARSKNDAKQAWAAGERGEGPVREHGKRVLSDRITESGDIEYGELRTACQSACATGAIVFGDLKDQNSHVSKLQRRNERTFDLLAELNPRPRTKYLGRVRNPHPSYKDAASSDDHSGH